jgi:hypothetical protein
MTDPVIHHARGPSHRSATDKGQKGIQVTKGTL